MAFISATWTASKATISINVNNILSVATIGENTVIFTVIANSNGAPFGYYVNETLNDINNRIDNALSSAQRG